MVLSGKVVLSFSTRGETFREPLVSLTALRLIVLRASQLAYDVHHSPQSLNITQGWDLVTAGGESSDAAVLRQHVGEDRGVAVTSGIDGSHSAADFVTGVGMERDKCLRIRSETPGSAVRCQGEPEQAS
jgi:hypothetical protein